MVKRSKRGNRTKKRYTKKEKKRYKKRYTKKGNTKNNNLKGGRLTPRQHELLRKVENRGNYCRKKNKFQKRDFDDCSSKVVCKWGVKSGETSERCMKDDEAIRSLNYSLVSDYYPPFTEINYQTTGGQHDQTTISQIPNLMREGIIDDLTLVWIDGMEKSELLGKLNLLESPVQVQARPLPPRDHESLTEPVTIDDTRPVVDSDVVDTWIRRRNEVEKTNTRECNSNSQMRKSWPYNFRAIYKLENVINCIYFDPNTNINIVCEVLRREAKPGSNIYLNIDGAHGSLAHQETSLNSNLHLIVSPARGHSDWTQDPTLHNSVEATIMKIFLDDGGDEDLFNNDPDKPYMTLRGSLLFYTLSLLHLFWFEDMNKILMEMVDVYVRTSPPDYEIQISQILKTINDFYLSGKMKDRVSLMLILFRILKLYKPIEKINDVVFEARKEENERKRFRKRIRQTHLTHLPDNISKIILESTLPIYEAKFGVTILYTNTDNINKYIHLPFSEVRRDPSGDILLSQIIKYLKPLEKLNHKFFMNHGSCRSELRRKDPDLSSLTREISTPKENLHKQCFINYFQEPQRKEVRKVLSRYHTLFDYYERLTPYGLRDAIKVNAIPEPLNEYITILIEHGEGSPELYRFIMDNH